MFKFKRNETGGTSPNFNPDPSIEPVVEPNKNVLLPLVSTTREKGRARRKRNEARQRVARVLLSDMLGQAVK